MPDPNRIRRVLRRSFGSSWLVDPTRNRAASVYINISIYHRLAQQYLLLETWLREASKTCAKSSPLVVGDEICDSDLSLWEILQMNTTGSHPNTTISTRKLVPADHASTEEKAIRTSKLGFILVPQRCLEYCCIISLLKLADVTHLLVVVLVWDSQVH